MSSLLLPLIKTDPEQRARRIREVLAETVVFHSPVADYDGARDVARVLATIGTVLDEVHTERVFATPPEVFTVITATYRGRRMTGAFYESYGPAGAVTSATLLLRPLWLLREAAAGVRQALELERAARGAGADDDVLRGRRVAASGLLASQNRW
jgi:hypothetical protein